ncbi:hypothetical protein OG562_35330 [Streptomyces sp. NBC_01275]|uniref:DUF7144 family membrane protein n=1 Tax=Streptomyces sp. NBC_01275 TaxID=2903807 RepID=UPI00225A2DD5|nr:hypothetical protein [Streptomyces sp. NBC_01275]MCX4766160.1 hypothetical protein [Streptomyces sp. NBC_01275]
MTSHPNTPTGNPHGEIGAAWSTPPGGPGKHSTRDSWVSGGVAFAGVLMLCSGVLGVLQGIAAIARDDVYTRVGDYVYKMSLTGWGWIHLVLGVLLAVTGAALLRDATWARFVGIFLAALSLVAQFLFLPYGPVWPITLMGIDVFVIWSLATRQEMAGRQ